MRKLSKTAHSDRDGTTRQEWNWQSRLQLYFGKMPFVTGLAK
jgi:hypothetical protein